MLDIGFALHKKTSENVGITKFCKQNVLLTN